MKPDPREIPATDHATDDAARIPTRPTVGPNGEEIVPFVQGYPHDYDPVREVGPSHPDWYRRYE